MEFRLIYDTIPEQFDRYRPRYCRAAFDAIIGAASVKPGTKVLELGPGTGQATDPVLDTGCDYLAIELGENLAAKMREKYGARPNFRLVNDDFITHDFGSEKFNLIYSAATIQWIPEDIAFSKTYDLLKPGGVLAMMKIYGDYRTPNLALYEKIQKVYSAYFHPTEEYYRGFRYENCLNYGYTGWECRTFRSQRIFTAEEYMNMCGTHCDHLVLLEPERQLFFDGLYRAVLEAGDRIVFDDTVTVYFARKPE